MRRSFSVHWQTALCAALLASACGGGDSHRAALGSSDAGPDAESSGAGGAGGKGGAGGAGGKGGTAGAGGGAVDAGSGGTTADSGSRDASVSDASLADASPPSDSSAPCTTGDASIVGSRIQIVFDTVNFERVKSLRWLDSTNTLTPNVVAEGGNYCGDPTESFGQAYGAPEGNEPYPIGGGTRSTRLACSDSLTYVTLPKNCLDVPQLPVTTEYRFYSGAKANQMRITRTFGFDASSPTYPGVGIRPYVPRMQVGQYPDTIYPNQTGDAIGTKSASSCGSDCLTPVGTDWNGKWIAVVDPNSKRAMIILRDPSMTTEAQFTVNNDGMSGSNLSSFVVVQPAGGWKAPLTEIEYFCFEDDTSWPAAARTAAQLPADCGP